jgi:hypothetical protein
MHWMFRLRIFVNPIASVQRSAAYLNTRSTGLPTAPMLTRNNKYLHAVYTGLGLLSMAFGPIVMMALGHSSVIVERPPTTVGSKFGSL